MNKKYTHILFDLDQTLWDFKANAKQVIKRLFDELNLEKLCSASFEDFIGAYKSINKVLWEEYRAGIIGKKSLNDDRFINTLKMFINDIEAERIGKEMANKYIKYNPENITLFEGVEDILSYLSEKYQLCIISNGFSEIQLPKLKNSGLDKYFTEVILSEDVGCLKPDKRFFNYTIEKTGASKEKCLVVGDDPESDIFGATNAGIESVWFKQPYHNGHDNPEPTFVIKSLAELKDIL
ncbi:MAG: YjjG family noncanonical pyrimidine nucleotidase [Bacteroidetes bacterium]|nr:YjjG family noncanonical pyrimidine nucleotidase [Bacteroidota bacterium]